MPPLDPLTPVADARLDGNTWHTWWRFNGESYLSLAARLEELDRRTGSDDYSLGAGESTRRSGLTPRTVIDQAVASLWTLIQEGRENDRTRAALGALARIQASWSLPTGYGVEATAPAMLGSGDQDAVEAMIVALGVSRSPESVELLLGVLSDNEAARSVCKVDSIDFRRRAFAAYGLAIAAGGEHDDATRKRIALALADGVMNENSPYDLQLACIVALGLVPMPTHPPGQAVSDGGVHYCRDAQIGNLLEFARDPARHAWLRAQARIPLARLAATASNEMRSRAMTLLLETLEPSAKAAPELVQASVIALGLLGDCDGDAQDVAAREALERAAVRGDRLTRGLALISLGKVGARAGHGEVSAPVQREIRELLLNQLMKGSDDRRAWSALALGVLGHDLALAHSDVPADLPAALRGALTSSRNTDDAAAACLALAVLRDPQSADSVLAVFNKTKEADLRSYSALALGWLGASQSVDPLSSIFAGGPRQGSLFSNSATSLRLLNATSVVPGLLEQAEMELSRKGEDDAGLVACAGLLGRIGDPRGLALLTKLTRDSSARKTSRAAAATALADLCDRAPHHWTSAISTDLHFGLLSSTLLSYSGNGTGLLEMR